MSLPRQSQTRIKPAAPKARKTNAPFSLGLIGALCGFCGKSAGFRTRLEPFELDDGSVRECEVRVCNACHELNGQYQPWWPRLARRDEVTSE